MRTKKAATSKAVLIFCLSMQSAQSAEVLLLEPNIQGTYSGDTVQAVMVGGKYFLDINDLADSLKFKFNTVSTRGEFLEKGFSLDGVKALDISGRRYYDIAALESVMPIDLEVDTGEMLLNVGSDKVLPTTQKMKNLMRAKKIRGPDPYDSFANYEFDDRYFSFPQMDLIYGFNHSTMNLGRPERQSFFGNYYQANVSMLMLGLDAHATIFGDDYGDNKLANARARVQLGQTFLNEPHNMLNLVQFRAGDVLGISNSMFVQGTQGRGLSASSFKDLVISAGKTIDITGPMAAGWQAELYLNNQLIGFRQGGEDGNYEFKNVPVNYGLNDFEVVLYGPFGEVTRIPRRYYSGTSPVKSGEFGYSINAYQANRFVIETNEPFHSISDVITADSLFYYGINDHVTLISGLTSTENPTDPGEISQFGTAGLQMALNGVSLQYNTNFNLNSGEIGHHAEAQGNIYIGDVFARYEYYGHTDSPLARYGGRNMRDLFESRLTGVLPWINTPYFLSYMQVSDYDNPEYKEFRARLSPNFFRRYNFTVENILNRRGDYTADDLNVLAQAFVWGRLRLNMNAAVRVYPEFGPRQYNMTGEYRWDKNTFVRAGYTHDFRSDYMNGMGDLDVFSVGMGRLFKFGGITVSAATDTDRNMSFGLRWNISLGKVPDRYDAFLNAETQMTNYGTIAVNAHDQYGNPVNGADIIVSGKAQPITTDEYGSAIITDISPYQKVMINVDTANLDDLALTPEFESKKLVLRPGVARPVNILFTRRGGLEGQLSKTNPNETYSVMIRNEVGETIAETVAESDGSFILDGIPYGEYVMVITNESKTYFMNVTIDKNFHSIKTPIEL